MIEASDDESRDNLVLRVQGLIEGIRPRLKCKPIFAIHGDNIVLAVEVTEKQDGPVYYHKHRPYIRDGCLSRPATPEEVQQLVWSHSSADYKRELEKILLDEKRAMQ